MIGALVALISLNLTTTLVGAGQIAGTLSITAATATTPIAVTSTAHGVPPGRVLHGVVSGVTGTVEANGTWQATPLDADTLALSTYSLQGEPVPSVGVHAYTGGGTISYALPEWSILLGRRYVALAGAVASPRIVFVPTSGRAWGLEPYGGMPTAVPNVEQDAEELQPQLATSYPTFEVYVTGCASPPSPDFGDFDATQAIVDALYSTIVDLIGPARALVLRDGWPSQSATAGTQTQRGQQWSGTLQLQHPVTSAPLAFVPSGTSLVLTVEPRGGTGTDLVTINLPPS